MATTTTAFLRKEIQALIFAISTLDDQKHERSAGNIHAYLVNLQPSFSSFSFQWTKTVEEIATFMIEAGVTVEDRTDVISCKLLKKEFKKGLERAKVLREQLEQQERQNMEDANKYVQCLAKEKRNSKRESDSFWK